MKNVQPLCKLKKMEQCNEKTFFILCHAQYKVCRMVIDRGNCTNVVTIIIVKKLGLLILKHP